MANQGRRGQRQPVDSDSQRHNAARAPGRPRKSSPPISPRARGTALSIGVLFSVMLLVAVGKLVYLQVIQAEALSLKAQEQRMVQEVIPARRGTIYDRDNEVIATSVQTYNVVANPRQVSDPLDIAELIGPLLDVETEELVALLTKSNTYYSPLAKSVEPDVKAAIERVARPLDNDDEALAKVKRQIRTLTYESAYRRTYPVKQVAGQVVGFVGGEGTGVYGIEQQYEKWLAGRPGFSLTERDPSRLNAIPAGVQKVIEPEHGGDIVLTIDIDIQHHAQRELAAAVKRHDALSGSVVVMDPRNGELLAVASYPFFDPNKYGSEDSDAFRNRAITDTFEPGSTLKCVTLAGALEAGLVQPETKFRVPYSMQVGSRTIRDSTVHETESWTVEEIIGKSSNVGTTLIAQDMGEELLYQTFTNFGIGLPAGLVFPSAQSGSLPDVSGWSDVSLANISFGQGVSTTPVQLARSISAIANGGILTTPKLVLDVPSDPSVIPESTDSRVVSSSTTKTATRILGYVMTDGTGQSISIPGYSIAGKTGTSQKAIAGQGYVKGKYVSSFIGYLPVGQPELLVLIVIDEPQGDYYGSVVAGRAFENIASFAASHLGIAPDDSAFVIGGPND